MWQPVWILGGGLPRARRFEFGTSLRSFAHIRGTGQVRRLGGGRVAQRLTQLAKSAAKAFQQGVHSRPSGDEVARMKSRHVVKVRH